MCTIEHVTKTIFKNTDRPVVYTSQGEQAHLVPCAESTILAPVVSITM